MHGEPVSYGYSNQMGYQNSEFRLLWTITLNPPPPLMLGSPLPLGADFCSMTRLHALPSQPTYCRPPDRKGSPSVPGHSAPTRVVVHLPTHLQRGTELQELALGPRPQRRDQGRRSSSNPPNAGRRTQELTLGPRP